MNEHQEHQEGIGRFTFAILTLSEELNRLIRAYRRENDILLKLCMKTFSNPDSKAAKRHDLKIIRKNDDLTVLSMEISQTQKAIDLLKSENKKTDLETISSDTLAEQAV